MNTEELLLCAKKCETLKAIVDSLGNRIVEKEYTIADLQTQNANLIKENANIIAVQRNMLAVNAQLAAENAKLVAHNMDLQNQVYAWMNHHDMNKINVLINRELEVTVQKQQSEINDWRCKYETAMKNVLPVAMISGLESKIRELIGCHAKHKAETSIVVEKLSAGIESFAEQVKLQNRKVHTMKNQMSSLYSKCKKVQKELDDHKVLLDCQTKNVEDVREYEARKYNEQVKEMVTEHMHNKNLILTLSERLTAAKKKYNDMQVVDATHKRFTEMLESENIDLRMKAAKDHETIKVLKETVEALKETIEELKWGAQRFKDLLEALQPLPDIPEKDAREMQLQLNWIGVQLKENAV